MKIEILKYAEENEQNKEQTGNFECLLTMIIHHYTSIHISAHSAVVVHST